MVCHSLRSGRIMRICRGRSCRSAPFKWFLGQEETPGDAAPIPFPLLVLRALEEASPSVNECQAFGWWIVPRRACLKWKGFRQQVVPLKNRAEHVDTYGAVPNCASGNQNSTFWFVFWSGWNWGVLVKLCYKITSLALFLLVTITYPFTFEFSSLNKHTNNFNKS